jgi:hypothetical protein
MNESHDYNPSTAFLGNSAKTSYAGFACTNGFAWQLRCVSGNAPEMETRLQVVKWPILRSKKQDLFLDHYVGATV